MILYPFPGPNYPLVRQKILHRKICLQVCILFSLYFTDCSINTGSGGSNIYQVRMLSKFQYIIWFFYEFFARILLLFFHKMSNSHLTYFLQIEEYNYIRIRVSVICNIYYTSINVPIPLNHCIT